MKRRSELNEPSAREFFSREIAQRAPSSHLEPSGTRIANFTGPLNELFISLRSAYNPFSFPSHLTDIITIIKFSQL